MKINLQKANKLIVIIGCICVIIVGYEVFRQKNPIILSITSDINIPSNMNELENDSELIVKIQVTNNAEENKEINEGKTPLKEHTLTEIKVLEVISGDKSSIGDVITVYEPYYYYSAFGLQKYLMTVEDYKPLTINNEYVLFLRSASNEGDNVYYLVGNQYGKYIAKDVNLSEITTNDIDIYQMDEHYIALYIEVMGKYMK